MTQVFVVVFVCCLTLVKFMYLVFTCKPGESYSQRLKSLLLCLCDSFGR